MNDKYRIVGRGRVRVIMGSKNLKVIAFYGKERMLLATSRLFRQAS